MRFIFYTLTALFTLDDDALRNRSMHDCFAHLEDKGLNQTNELTMHFLHPRPNKWETFPSSISKGSFIFDHPLYVAG